MISDATLRTKFNKYCDTYGTKNHELCKEIQSDILQIYKSGSKLSNTTAEWYLKSFLVWKYNSLEKNSDNHYFCMNDPENYMYALNEIMKDYDIPFETIEKLISSGHKDLAFDLIERYKVNIDFSLIFNIKDIEMKEYLLKKIPVSLKILQTACCEDTPEFMLHILSQKIQPDDICFENALQSGSTENVKLLLDNGLSFEKKYLIKICEAHNLELMKLFFDKKIIPDADCFNALFKNVTSRDWNWNPSGKQTKSIYGRHRGYSITTSKQIGTISEAIDILTDYGYKLTYDNVLVTIRNKIIINNFEKYGIELDHKFIKEIVSNKFNPYDLNKLNITQNIECLRELSNDSFGSYNYIHDLIKHHGIKPDRKCVNNIIASCGNPSLQLILSIFLEDIDNNSSHDKGSSNKDNSHNYQEKINHKVKKEMTKMTTDDDTIKDKVNDNNVINIKAPAKKPYKNQKTKMKLNAKGQTFFHTTGDMSFLDMRKKLTKYISDNNLCKTIGVRIYITVDKLLAKSFGFTEDQLINFDDLDNLVMSTMI